MFPKMRNTNYNKIGLSGLCRPNADKIKIIFIIKFMGTIILGYQSDAFIYLQKH